MKTFSLKQIKKELWMAQKCYACKCSQHKRHGIMQESFHNQMLL